MQNRFHVESIVNKVTSMDYTATFYSRPSYVGSGVIFSGARRQRGGSILGALKATVLPILSAFGPKILRSVGNIAKKQLFKLGTDVVRDKIMGKKLSDSFAQHGKARLLEGAKEGLSSIGSAMNLTKHKPRGVAKRRKQRGSGKKKSTAKQTPSRKRKASCKRTPPAKKRRANF